MRPGRFLVPLGVLLLALGLAAAGFGPAVRARLNEKAARYGASVSVERVRPVWLGARLEGVEVRFLDLPSARVQFQTITVSLDTSGATRDISVAGGELAAAGDVEQLRNEVRALARRFSGGGTSSGVSTGLHLSGLRARWQHQDESASASGISAERGPQGWEMTLASAEWKLPRHRATVEGAQLSLRRSDQGARLLGWKARQLTLETSLEEDPAMPAPATSAAVPTTSVGVPVASGIASSPGKPALKKPTAPGAPEPVASPGSGRMRQFQEQAQRWKERAHRVAQEISVALAEGSFVEIEQLKATVHRGKEALHVGPGALTLKATGRGVGVSLAPLQSGSGNAPLLVSAEIPADSKEGLALRVNGGPVTLALLGVHEGDFGLLDVEKASIEAGGEVKLSGDASRIDVDLSGVARGLSLEHRKLSTEPVRGLDLRFAWVGGVALDGSSVRVDRGEFGVGKVTGELSGSFERQGDGQTIQGKFAVPLASCQAALEGLPAGLAPALVGMKMTGTFSVSGRVAFESKRPEKTDVEFQFLNDCRVTTAPPLVEVGRFRQPFRKRVYDPSGKPVEVETGPGTPGWVSLAGITRFMEAAVLTTEDGGFRRHRGFDQEAIRNSIRENLKAGRFLRGASTISMQTAKNLYLYRDKTVGRKLQEAFLTMYLEQALSKEQILELYLNSIEFGPMIYGIGPAAQHYFKTSPGELSLGQALYLASILPNPKRQHFGADGKVTGGFMGYLHRLMRGMAKRQLIREDELEDGLAEWVVFGQPPVVKDREKLPDELDDPNERATLPDVPGN
jgi:hypothetical protein